MSFTPQTTAKSFTTWYRMVRKDPEVFVEKAMQWGVGSKPPPTEQQAEVIHSLKEDLELPVDERKKRLAVKSGNGVGKTALETCLAAYRTVARPKSMTVISAPSLVQCSQIWFSEFRRQIADSHPFLRSMFEITNTRAEVMQEPTWQIVSRTASRPEAAQGFHIDDRASLTIIIDEASGVDFPIWEAFLRTLTGTDGYLIACGNPNYRETKFHAIWAKPNESELWIKHTFDSRKSPIVSQDHVKRLVQEYGANSDPVRVGVYGEFPLADPNCIISSEQLYACQTVPMLEAAKRRMPRDEMPKRAISIDVARFGADESVIYRRSGLAIVETKRFTKTEPLDVAREAIRMARRAGWVRGSYKIIVDATGMGQAVAGYLIGEQEDVYEFMGHRRASETKYHDELTEAWFHLARIVKPKACHLPDDDHLVRQLATRIYTMTPKGRIAVEPKKEYRRRLNAESPDRADSMVMAYYHCSAGVSQVG